MLLSSSSSDNNSSSNLPSDSIDDVYGGSFYNNPITNPAYTQTLQDMNVDQFIYDLLQKNNTAGLNKPLLSSVKSQPHFYEGNKVVTESILIQNLQVDSLRGMDAPQYFSEPGYLCSFLLAVNDPLMALKIYIKGQDESGYSVADYSIRKMAMLGMGMTLGEAEELIFTSEGETARDVSGTPSTEFPYIARYKHLPSGTETNYDLYKGTEFDSWCVVMFQPKEYLQFNTLFFDIYNSNTSGPRLIHYLEIKRHILITDKMGDTVPSYNKSIISLPPLSESKVDDLIGVDKPLTTTTSSYTRTSGKIKKVNNNPFLTNPSNGIYSINKDQQKDKLFNDIVKTNHDIFNDLVSARFQEAKRLRKF